MVSEQTASRTARMFGARVVRVPRWLVVALALGGLVARIIILRGPIGVLDSDEAVVGLMARHFLHGDVRAFFWGQHYGGTIETGATAALFWVFGTSTTALKVVPLLFYAAATALFWRLGRRLIGPGPATVAALLVWVWPSNYLWWSVKARGFYEVTLCLTLAAALLVVRIAQDADRSHWADWAGLGLVAGLGWWQSPQIVYILAPAGLWALWPLRLRAWRAVATVPGIAVGALPWLWANVGHGFPSLTSPPAPVPGGYLSHLRVFFHLGLPMTLGLRVVYSTRWIGPATLGGVAYAAAVAAVVFACIRRWPGGRVAAAVIVAYPFLNSLLTLSGVVSEGRYTLFLLPWLALALARAADRVAAAAVLAAIALAFAAGGIVDLRGQTSPYAPDRRVPASMAALERSLTEHRATRVWANYWIAYRLTFETHERVIAAPTLNDRFPAYTRAVSSAADPAFVFLAASHDAAAFRSGLDHAAVPYTRWTVGSDWVVYVPGRHVGPTQIAGSYT